MHWLRRNGIGLAGLTLAILAFAFGLIAYQSGVQRDEQKRGIALRLQRDEAELAERHRRAVAALSGLSDALRTLTFYAAGVAIVIAAWDARHRPSLWLTWGTAILAVGAIGLAIGSKATP